MESFSFIGENRYFIGENGSFIGENQNFISDKIFLSAKVPRYRRKLGYIGGNSTRFIVVLDEDYVRHCEGGVGCAMLYEGLWSGDVRRASPIINLFLNKDSCIGIRAFSQKKRLLPIFDK